MSWVEARMGGGAFSLVQQVVWEGGGQRTGGMVYVWAVWAGTSGGQRQGKGRGEGCSRRTYQRWVWVQHLYISLVS